MQGADQSVGALLSGFQSGRKGAADELFQWLYPELRRIAARQMSREGAGHSWQPTLLVNELYLELLRNKALDSGKFDESQKAAFLALAGFLMRRLLILHSRPLRQRVEEAGPAVLDAIPSALPGPENLHFVEGLLDRLGAVDPRLRTVVEMRVFEGKSHEEIAAHLNCTVRTVGTHWSYARRWLEQNLAPAP
ncbi:MAG: hypothetical protein JNL98_04175 [Bryobacterales bacterium]|nr:hypothetical protein [Bryobacterales bacterium]